MIRNEFSRRAVLGLSAAGLTSALIHRSVGATPVANEPISVRMITHLNGLGDNGYNDLANAGGLRAASELGVEFAVVESVTPADFEANVLDSANTVDLTVGVGDLLNQAITSVAGQTPDAPFAILDSFVDLPNVRSYTFREQEAYYLAGILAASMSTSGKLGIVGGIRVPPLIRSEVGFVAGATSVDPEIEVVIAYADSFEDPDKGKEIALAQIADGADILLPIAGMTSLGVYTAAAESDGVWIVSADADKSVLAPGIQLGVARKAIDDAMFDAISLVDSESFQGGAQNWGLADGGVDLTMLDTSVPADVVAAIDAARAAIIDGSLVVPATDEELEQLLAGE